MKIATKVNIHIFLFAAFSLIMLGAFMIMSHRVDKSLQNDLLINRIVSGVNDLNAATYDFVLRPDERPRLQWELKHASLAKLIETVQTDEEALLDHIALNHGLAKSVFEKLVQKSDVLGYSEMGPHMYHEEDTQRLVAQLIAKTRMISAYAALLTQASTSSILALNRKSFHIAGGIMLLMIGVVASTSILLKKKLTVSLRDLRRGTETIAAGNLAHRVGMAAKDEIGELAGAFDLMTEKLESTTVSRDALRVEVEERKRAEEELRKSREWLKVTLSSIGDAVIATDQTGLITFMNPIGEQLTGWDLKSASGQPVQNVFRIINEKTHVPAENIVERVLREGCVVNLANHTALIARDGTEIPIEDSAAPIRDGAGNLVGTVLVFHDVTEKRRAQEALQESERRVRTKLESIISPEGNLGQLDLADIIDSDAIQSLMNGFYGLTRFPMSIVDLSGKLLVGVGWQKICTDFHRTHPQTCRHCIESDTQLSAGIPAGEFKLYKCKNGMWDIASPIFIGARHLGNLFSGQFFFDDEEPDYESFRVQARRYGFDEKDYLAALEKVPRLSRKAVESGMAFLLELAQMFSQMSYSNLKLARSLAERDALAEALRESTTRLQLLGDNLPESAVYQYAHEPDGSCRFLHFSAGIERLNAVRVEDVLRDPSTLHEQIPPEYYKPLKEAELRSARDLTDFHMDVPMHRPDGQVRWMRLHSRPRRMPDGRTIWDGVQMDVTERRQMEEQLRKSRDELEVRVQERTAELSAAVARLELLNHELQEFAFIASHDLQEPLRKIQTFGNLLIRKHRETLNPEGKDHLERMIKAAHRMSDLLRALLYYSRTGTSELNLQIVSPAEVINEVVGDLEILLKKAEARIEIGDLPEIRADALLIRQLVQNIIENSIKYRKDSEPPVVRIHGSVRNDSCQLVFQDNGIGFEEEFTANIFKPFERLHGKDSPYRGTGMGLAICKKIVDRHGGRITASSTPGRGSTFIVTFPKGRASGAG